MSEKKIFNVKEYEQLSNKDKFSLIKKIISNGYLNKKESSQVCLITACQNTFDNYHDAHSYLFDDMDKYENDPYEIDSSYWKEGYLIEEYMDNYVDLKLYGIWHGDIDDENIYYYTNRSEAEKHITHKVTNTNTQNIRFFEDINDFIEGAV